MKKFLHTLEFDYYIKSPILPLSCCDKFYLMSKNDTV